LLRQYLVADKHQCVSYTVPPASVCVSNMRRGEGNETHPQHRPDPQTAGPAPASQAVDDHTAAAAACKIAVLHNPAGSLAQVAVDQARTAAVGSCCDLQPQQGHTVHKKHSRLCENSAAGCL
jgi:hypothetical protein